MGVSFYQCVLLLLIGIVFDDRNNCRLDLNIVEGLCLIHDLDLVLFSDTLFSVINQEILIRGFNRNHSALQSPT